MEVWALLQPSGWHPLLRALCPVISSPVASTLSVLIRQLFYSTLRSLRGWKEGQRWAWGTEQPPPLLLEDLATYFYFGGWKDICNYGKDSWVTLGCRCFMLQIIELASSLNNDILSCHIQSQFQSRSAPRWLVWLRCGPKIRHHSSFHLSSLPWSHVSLLATKWLP